MRIFRFLIIIFASLIFLYPASSLSRENIEFSSLKYKDSVTQATKSVGTRCAERLSKVREILQQDEVEQDLLAAETVIKSAFGQECRPGIEYSQLNLWLGYIYYMQGRIELAVEAYLAVVNEPESNKRQRINTRYTLAKLLFIKERYKSAVEQLEAWQAEATILDPDGLILLARGYYKLDRISDALNITNEMVEREIDEGKIPNEDWLNLQWVLNLENKNYPMAIFVSDRLLRYYPKDEYWKQLTYAHRELKDFSLGHLTRNILSIDISNKFFSQWDGYDNFKEADIFDNDQITLIDNSELKINIGTLGDFSRDTDFIPIYVPRPYYPREAYKTGMKGYAVVSVIITEVGDVRSVKLMEEWPEGYGFGKSAKKAAYKLKYNPRVINGIAVEVPGVLYKFSFMGFPD